MSWPSRVELRFLNLRALAPEVREISGELELLLTYAKLGLYDGHALFNHLQDRGLKPSWANSSNIRLEDPIAGSLLVCCEHCSMTIH